MYMLNIQACRNKKWADDRAMLPATTPDNEPHTSMFTEVHHAT